MASVLTVKKKKKKKLDPVAGGWPLCLRAQSHSPAHKLTLGQIFNVKVPHTVVWLTSTQGYHFLSNSQLTQYQGLLYENPRVTLETVRTLNPATFLPREEGEPNHDCFKVVDEVYTSRPDLQD